MEKEADREKSGSIAVALVLVF